MRVRLRIVLVVGVWAVVSPTCSALAASADEPHWVFDQRQLDDDTPVVLFVDSSDASSERPAFKVETSFPVSPGVAALTFMDGMLEPDTGSKGERRRVLERSARSAVVYTFVDLPFMLADRELALRVEYSDDAKTGIHRVEWVEANDFLPESQPGVVRLTGVKGFWEFRPTDEASRTLATYVTRTNVGGSIPNVIAHRLMKSRTLDAARELRRRILDRLSTHVAGAPPSFRAVPAEPAPPAQP